MPCEKISLYIDYITILRKLIGYLCRILCPTRWWGRLVKKKHHLSMHFLGFAQHLFRFRKANTFYFLSALSAFVVVTSFIILIATLVIRSFPVFTKPSYEVQIEPIITADNLHTDSLSPSDDVAYIPDLPSQNERLSQTHPSQDVTLVYKAGQLELFQSKQLVATSPFAKVTQVFPSNIPFVFYLVVSETYDATQLFRVHWQANKPLQSLLLFELSEEQRLVSVIESDIHNIVHLLLHKDGVTQLVMLNLVTAEALTEVEIEGIGGLDTAKRDSIKLRFDDNVITVEVLDLEASVTLKELFLPHAFPGYDNASLTWQTNPAQDYQLRKYNIMPLIIGSLKASAISLVVALPIALGAAIYVGFLAKSNARTWLKPVIEVLESIPAVIIGLIAATFLFNVAVSILWSVVTFVALLPIYMALNAYVYQLCKRSKFERLFIRFELIIVVLSLLCFLWLSSALGTWLTTWSWIQTVTPSNQIMLVVALGLGVGIAPTIFSLAEDAINGVPKTMIKASYALGATRVQTLSQIVLFTAFPGLMAAVMLGFGRAFGETMIVLMVSGNTPVAEWDIFTGLRALTANLVIEMPEANSQNSHLVVLFLTALVLFLFTFVLNCSAEWLRQRNKKARGRLQ